MTQAVILAGGLGTRLGSLTSQTPKSLVQVLGEPFIDWQLKLLQSKGITEVILCLGHLGNQVIDFLNERNYEDLKIKFSHDTFPNQGTLGALLNASHLLDDIFFVTYGDSFLDTDYMHLLRDFNTIPETILMTFTRQMSTSDFANIMKKRGRLISYKKNLELRKEYTFTDYGLLILRKNSLEHLNIGVNDLSIALEVVSEKNLVAGQEIANRYYEIGSSAGIIELEEYLQGSAKWIM